MSSEDKFFLVLGFIIVVGVLAMFIPVDVFTGPGLGTELQP